MNLFKLFLVLIFTNLIFSNENDFEKFLSKFYQNYSSSGNKISLGFYGVSYQYNNHEISNRFKDIYPVAIEYGFSRYLSKIFYDDYKYFSNEYAFYEHGNIGDLNNTDLGFRPLSFGFSWADGYTYSIKKRNITLLHDRGISWTKLRSPIREIELRPYNFNWRFGGRFSSGLGVEIKENYFIDLLYTKNYIQQKFEIDWFFAFGLESILARFPFYFDSQFNNIFGKFTPLVIWVYKTALSYYLFERWEQKQNWPFESLESLNGQGFKLRMRFTFTD